MVGIAPTSNRIRCPMTTSLVYLICFFSHSSVNKQNGERLQPLILVPLQGVQG